MSPSGHFEALLRPPGSQVQLGAPQACSPGSAFLLTGCGAPELKPFLSLAADRSPPRGRAGACTTGQMEDRQTQRVHHPGLTRAPRNTSEGLGGRASVIAGEMLCRSRVRGGGGGGLSLGTVLREPTRTTGSISAKRSKSRREPASLASGRWALSLLGALSGSDP